MIPLRPFLSAALAGLLVGGLPGMAHADVLQVEEGGARWISGMPAYARPLPAPSVTSAPSVDPLAQTPAGFAPAQTPDFWRGHLGVVAARYDLDPALLEALIWQESRWRTNAISPVGARGLTQLMPETARQMGVNPDDPLANLDGGARYLRQQLNTFNGDLVKALAAYNAGPKRVQQAGGVPRIRETQNYVAAILGRLTATIRR